MIEPLGSNVVCLRAEPKKQTDGGVLLPESVQDRERPQEATIVAIGPGKRHPDTGQPMPIHGGVLNVGDKLLIGRFAGVEAEHERAKYLVIDEGDILARINA